MFTLEEIKESIKQILIEPYTWELVEIGGVTVEREDYYKYLSFAKGDNNILIYENYSSEKSEYEKGHFFITPRLDDNIYVKFIYSNGNRESAVYQ